MDNNSSGGDGQLPVEGLAAIPGVLARLSAYLLDTALIALLCVSFYPLTANVSALQSGPVPALASFFVSPAG